MINTIYSINAKPFLGEDEKYHYLYQITNIANGKIYVGIHSTTNLNDGYSGSGKVIIRAIEKSGEENFIKEIKCFYKNREELAKAENEIVNEEFIKDENTYNLVHCLCQSRSIHVLYKIVPANASTWQNGRCY